MPALCKLFHDYSILVSVVQLGEIFYKGIPTKAFKVKMENELEGLLL